LLQNTTISVRIILVYSIAFEIRIKISIPLRKNDKTGIIMEDNFRNALIILSAVVIAAIFIHGLWTIRKQKNPYKLKASQEKVKPLSRDFDGKGFDQDGVGQVKVIKKTNGGKASAQDDFGQSFSHDEIGHLDGRQNTEMYDELTYQQQNSASDIDKSAVVADSRQEIILEKPLYQQPVTQAKPVSQKIIKKRVDVKPEANEGETKRPQMEINFGEGLSLVNESVPTINLDDSNEPAPLVKENSTIEVSAPAPKVIILSVVMPDHQQMSGAQLLPSLLTLGMKYGEMDIFHRHQDSAGNGAVTFSLANMLNPGSFDLDTMETFVTQGVSLFMTLPNETDPFASFDQMLAAAKQLAAEFNAQIVDDKRNVMTKQTEQHYVGNIREFDRQYRLASAE
jgi:cell division protein ZipA